MDKSPRAGDFLKKRTSGSIKYRSFTMAVGEGNLGYNNNVELFVREEAHNKKTIKMAII